MLRDRIDCRIEKSQYIIGRRITCMAVEPKELTDDCKSTLEKLMIMLWICRDSDLKNLLQINAFDLQF